MRGAGMAVALMLAAAPARADDASKAPAPEPPRSGFSLALGWGGGALPGTEEDMFRTGSSYVMQAGFRLSSSLWLVFDNRHLTGATDPSDSNRSVAQGAFTSGVRWAPFGVAGGERSLAALDLRRFWIMGGAGLGMRGSSPRDRFFARGDMDYGLAATGGVGWIPLGGRGWSLGLELTDSVVRAAGETRQHVVTDILLTVEL
jgi:hypothetical protein